MYIYHILLSRNLKGEQRWQISPRRVWQKCRVSRSRHASHVWRYGAKESMYNTQRRCLLLLKNMPPSTFTFHMSNLARHRFHVCPDRVQGPGSGSGADRACTWLPHLLQLTPIQFKSPRICSLGSIPLREIEVCLWAESRITRISIQWTMLDTGDPARGAR